MSLRDKILKAVKDNANAAIFTESPIIGRKEDFAPTDVPMLNVALSGKWNGGIGAGITILAGPSKNGKTYIGLKFVQAYLNKHQDAMCVFLDSELGANKLYFERLGIDMTRVVHVPLMDIEEAKFQTIHILEDLEKDEKVIFFFDSIGNIPSKKEVEDAKEEKSAADMTRAKQLKSYFRIITPYVNKIGIPFVCINHTYQTMSFIPTETMGGGTGAMYSADTVFFMGKAQDKDGTELAGYNFKLKVEKSRCIREKSVFTLNSSFADGIDKYSDLFEFALEHGEIVSPSKGFYQKAEKYNDEKKYRRADFIRNDNMWVDIIADKDFQNAYEQKYAL